jgi:hypothetical protein
MRASVVARKKTPAQQPGSQAFLLSHIKAPAQGGKAGSGQRPPGRNLAKRAERFKLYIAPETHSIHPHSVLAAKQFMASRGDGAQFST